MKIVLFGSSGLLGTSLKNKLWDLGIQTVAPSSKETNFLVPNEVRSLLSREMPDVIINAAAYTDVNAAENNFEKAVSINCTAVKEISEFTSDHNRLLVHYSTDFVFDGTKATPYKETDRTKPQNKYGESKFLGEQAIMKSGCRNFIFRTSWLYGHNSKNFASQILEQAEKNDPIKAVYDKIGSPTHVDVLSNISLSCLLLYQGNKGCDIHEEIHGIYHLACKGAASRYEFAQALINEGIKLNMFSDQKLNNLFAIHSNEFKSIIQRPDYSALCCSKLIETFGINIPNWQSQVAGYVKKQGKN